MPRERILITVKTYPNLSSKYVETVCTAGLREDGSWVRIYPVPFRGLEDEQQYKKFSWIECDLVKNKNDWRPESYRPVDVSQLTPVSEIQATKSGWRDRRHYVIEKAGVYTNLVVLIERAKKREISLAVFKPSNVLDFVWERDSIGHDEAKLERIRQNMMQQELFDEPSWPRTKELVEKLPYKFSYVFEDDAGKTSRIQVLDWELGALYRNCLRASEGNEAEALPKIRQKYLDEFVERDLHFFLGTTLEFHMISPNPWQIIGVFAPPHDDQPGLF